MKITPNFELAEFNCKSGEPYPNEWIEPKLKPLCEQLEKIRALTGQPVKIVSGYRTKDWNTKLYYRMGLKPTASKHIEGIAADILLEGMTILELYKAIEFLIKQKTIQDGGLGLYYTHVHYDIRGQHARWNYTNWQI